MSYSLSTFVVNDKYTEALVKYRECMPDIDGAFDGIPKITEEMHTIAEDAKKLIEESYTSFQWYDEAASIISLTNEISEKLKEDSIKTLDDIVQLIEDIKDKDKLLALFLDTKVKKIKEKREALEELKVDKTSDPKKPTDPTSTDNTQTKPDSTESPTNETGTGTDDRQTGPNTGDGDTVAIPDSVRQTGICGNSEPYDIKWNSGTGQNTLHGLWADSGKTNQNGIATYNGNYIVACSEKFGKTGDQIDVNLKDGQVIHCIIGDSKSMGDSNANEWGHQLQMKSGYATDIIEWCSYGGDSIDCGTYRNVGVESITNNGSVI